VDVDLFEALDNYPPNFAIEVLFYASRMLRHANSLARLENAPLVARFADEPNSKAFALAVQLLRKIEQMEGAPIASLGAEEVQRYSRILTGLVETYSKRGYQPDVGRGQKLLSEFRKKSA
jgi:hypothetical protein